MQGQGYAAARHQPGPPAVHQAGRQHPRGRGGGIVNVDDLRTRVPKNPPEAEDGPGLQIASEGEGSHREPRGSRATFERPTRLTSDCALMASRRHLEGGEQDLALAPSPFVSGIDVDYSHGASIREDGRTPWANGR